MIIRFYWIWIWKYLHCDLGIPLIWYASIEVWGLPWFVDQRLNKLLVSSWFKYSGGIVELVARAIAAFELKMNIIVSSEKQRLKLESDYQEMLSKHGLVDPHGRFP